MLKMEINGDTVPIVSAASIPSPSTTSSPPPQPQVVLTPCAACKILRRRCAEKCVLAPYFPPTEPAKFTIAHRVFGASNIIKLLQELPESQRNDAVNSIVYEAGARIRDPVYGCAGTIYHLQRQVSELQAQLAKTQVELVNAQLQRANLLSLLRNNSMDQPSFSQQHQGRQDNINPSFCFESGDEFISSPDEDSSDLGLFEYNNNSNDINSHQCLGGILFGHDDDDYILGLNI